MISYTTHLCLMIGSELVNLSPDCRSSAQRIIETGLASNFQTRIVRIPSLSVVDTLRFQGTWSAKRWLKALPKVSFLVSVRPGEFHEGPMSTSRIGEWTTVFSVCVPKNRNPNPLCFQSWRSIILGWCKSCTLKSLLSSVLIPMKIWRGHVE